MSRSTSHFGITTLLLGIAIAASRPAAANCGAEGCPLAARGPETVAGRFSFGLRHQFVEQDRLWDGSRRVSAADEHEPGGGPHEIELLTRTRTWTFDARARLLPLVDLAVSVPYVDRIHRHAVEHHAGFLLESAWRMQGLGDATALASWTAFASPGASRAALVLIAGAELPTGERQAEEVDGEQPEPPARLGSGSTDWIAGVSWQAQLPARGLAGGSVRLPVNAGASLRVNGRGTDRYRSGREWQADLGASYPLVRSLRLLAQLHASGHAPDDVGDTDAEAHHTGGSSVFGSPGLQAILPTGVSAYAYGQFRIWQHTRGPQLVSPYRLVFGLGYALP